MIFGVGTVTPVGEKLGVDSVLEGSERLRQQRAD